MKRRALLQGAAALSISHLSSAFGQATPGKVAKVAVLSSQSAGAYAGRVDALKSGLADLGYVEGKNLRMEYRWAGERLDRLPGLIDELLAWKPDVIVTHGTPSALALKKATTTVPIVVATTGDAVAVGLVPSFAQPGGNITGNSFLQPEIMVKRLELLREVMPRLAHIGVLSNPDNDASKIAAAVLAGPAKALKVSVTTLSVRSGAEIESMLAGIGKRGLDALLMEEDATINTNGRKIAEALAKERIASVGYGDYAKVGGLIGYGVNIDALWRRTAYFVDRIIKGARPRDLPFERATRFELLINARTASALGIPLPRELLARADEVIR